MRLFQLNNRIEDDVSGLYMYLSVYYFGAVAVGLDGTVVVGRLLF